MESGHYQESRWAQQQQEREIVGPFFIWGGGVLFPLVILMYGLSCILRQEALLMGPRTGTMLYGIDAAAMGIGLLALAILVHIQCFWDGQYDSTLPAARGKLVCLAIMGLCAYFLCFRMLPGLL